MTVQGIKGQSNSFGGELHMVNISEEIFNAQQILNSK
jgi:hypothetical protein